MPKVPRNTQLSAAAPALLAAAKFARSVLKANPVEELDAAITLAEKETDDARSSNQTA